MKILFVIPTLNSFKTLPRLLDSLLEQSSLNWRAIFVDGPSCQEHKDYLTKQVSCYPFFSLIELPTKKGGIFGAMNVGYNQAQIDEWTIFLGSDDRLSSKDVVKKLLEVIEHYIGSQNLKLVIGKGTYYDENQKVKRLAKFSTSNLLAPKLIGNMQYLYMIFTGATPPHQCTMFAPASLASSSGFNTRFSIAADLFAFLQLSRETHNVYIEVPIDLCDIFIGGVSHEQSTKRIKEVITCYWKRFGLLLIFPFVFRYLRKLSHKYYSPRMDRL